MVGLRKLFQQRGVGGSAQGIQLFLNSNSYANMTASESKLFLDENVICE